MYNAFTVHEIYCLKHLQNRERIQLKSILQDIGRSCIIITDITHSIAFYFRRKPKSCIKSSASMTELKCLAETKSDFAFVHLHKAVLHCVKANAIAKWFLILM